MNSSNPSGRLTVLWQFSLASFILAGLTGFLYRLGLAGVQLGDLGLQNIRHAHSHLMFFSWAVPMPLYFIIQRITAKRNPGSSGNFMYRMALASLIFGLLSYPFFLIYGYRPVLLLGMELPLSVICSGLVMLCWYGFMAGYLKVRKNSTPGLPMIFWDASLLMLFICSLGAWGVAAVQSLAPANQLLMKALTHFFLATFTEGWIVLVLVGLLYDRLNISLQETPVPPGWLAGLILFGAPLTFPYGISEGLLSPQLLLVARLGGLLAGVGLLLNLYLITQKTNGNIAGYWKVILWLLGLKALSQLLASVLPSAFWLSVHGLRILYLHMLLLGAFTLALFTALSRPAKFPVALTYFAASVLLLLFSLLPMTPLWPTSWFAYWQLYAIAGIAALPPLVAIWFWAQIKRTTVPERNNS